MYYQGRVLYSFMFPTAQNSYQIKLLLQIRQLANSISNARLKLLNVEGVLKGLHDPLSGPQGKLRKRASFQDSAFYEPADNGKQRSLRFDHSPDNAGRNRLSKYCPEVLAEFNKEKRNRIYNKT